MTVCANQHGWILRERKSLDYLNGQQGTIHGVEKIVDTICMNDVF